jgi:hypothetical protein
MMCTPESVETAREQEVSEAEEVKERCDVLISLMLSIEVAKVASSKGFCIWPRPK